MSVATSLKRSLSKIPKYIFRRPLREILCRRPLHANLSKPIISFTFDDFPRSAWTTGGRILMANDMRGTYYISLSLMGSATHLGEQFTRGDLAELLENEHEVACHTFIHFDCRAVRLSAYLDDITEHLETTPFLPDEPHCQPNITLLDNSTAYVESTQVSMSILSI